MVCSTWYCSKYEFTFEDYDYRYVLQVNIENHTNTIWSIAFKEPTTKLIGIPAKELYMLQFNQDEEATTDEVIKNVLFNQFIITLSSRNKTYNIEARLNQQSQKSIELISFRKATFLFYEIPMMCNVNKK